MRFTCSVLVTLGEQSVRIDHRNDFLNQPPTTSVSLRDETGLRDAQIVSIECNDDEVIILCVIDGASPNAPRVAVCIDGKNNTATIGKWEAKGRTLKQLSQADKKLLDMREAAMHHLYLLVYAG